LPENPANLPDRRPYILAARPGERRIKRRVNHDSKGQSYEGSAQDRYRVTLLNDKWPDDKTLIDWCDPDNLGGYVGQKTDRFCVVTVYKD
jgi:hypothetical protein